MSLNFVGSLLVALTLLLGACGNPEVPSEVRLPPIYTDAAAQTGLTFHHFSGATGEYFFPEIVGAGVALLDFDQDGDLDVYLIQSGVVDPTKSWDEALVPVPANQPRGNRLFRNELVETGSLRFVDVTDAAGVGEERFGLGAAVGDFDNDGYPDLYVTNFGSNILYRNRGDGTFEDVTKNSGTDDPRFSTSASFVDYDQDGDLDLYVVNYVQFHATNNKQCSQTAGIREYCGPQEFPPTSDRLFRNDGRGSFADVSAQLGIGAVAGPGLGVVTADFNRDGRVDFYVANDGSANHLWINRGPDGFEETALISGAAYNTDGKEEAGMGTAAGDFDGDGDDDLFVTNQAAETNSLYVNDGAGNFYDRTLEFGLSSTSLRFTGFGCNWLDFDNDGDLDLFAANGAVYAEKSLVGKHVFPYQQTNQLFRSEGQARFTDISAEAGPALALSEVSRGAAFGDIDNDGDVDIVVSNSNGPVRLLLNEVGTQKHWLSVLLTGTKSSRDGTGAQVALMRKNKPLLWRRAHRDGSYLSANDIRVHFGLGDDPAIEGVGVRWPTGLTEVWRSGIHADTQLALKEGSGTPWNLPVVLKPAAAKAAAKSR